MFSANGSLFHHKTTSFERTLDEIKKFKSIIGNNLEVIRGKQKLFKCLHAFLAAYSNIKVEIKCLLFNIIYSVFCSVFNP